MPTHREIRNQIVTGMKGITDIGQVHAYERYAKRESELKAQYLYQKQIRGWYVRRINRAESSPGLGRFIVTTQWQIRGYMSLDDGNQSELVFDDLVDNIVDIFRGDDTLNGLVQTCIIGQQAGVKMDDSGPVMFAGVLCHSARLSLMTMHIQ